MAYRAAEACMQQADMISDMAMKSLFRARTFRKKRRLIEQEKTATANGLLTQEDKHGEARD